MNIPTPPLEEMKWINTNEELPPENNTYEVTNFPEYEDDSILRKTTTLAFYDGWGFQWSGVYIYPSYWRNPKPYDKRRYGKIE